MGDSMSAGGGGTSMGMGLAQYLSSIQANRNARAVNATDSKWAPLLALNKSQGKADIPVPTASFAKIMGPAIISAMNSGNMMSQGTPAETSGGSASDISGMDSPGAQAFAGGQGESAGFDPSSMLGGGGASMMAAGGGKVPKYAGGGMPSIPGMPSMGGGGGQQGGSSGMSSIMSLLPMLAMLAPGGGMVPGSEVVPGDSPKNDNKLIGASAGEVVVPKSVVNDPNKWKVAAYLQEVKKHGPGPMPIKGQQNGMKAQPPRPGGIPTQKPGSSMSPWAAMCGGGMAR